MDSIFDSPAFSSRLFFPRALTSAPPPGAIDELLAVAPGVRVHLRVHAAPSARALVLLFHGNGEVVADYDAAAADYAAVGARLAVVDYRGYGASSGVPTLRSALSDARVVLAAARAASTLPLIVMGRSLGSACAAELAGALPPLAGLILESGFTDLLGLVARRGVTLQSPLPSGDLAAFDPLPKLRASTTPLLVLHGALDTLIAPTEGRAAHDAAGTLDRRLVLVPGRGHNDVSAHPLYWASLRSFVEHVTGT
ncbi:MAG: alpha/beta fold hydrolase [Byssovorax sp.]